MLKNRLLFVELFIILSEMELFTIRLLAETAVIFLIDHEVFGEVI